MAKVPVAHAIEEGRDNLEDPLNNLKGAVASALAKYKDHQLMLNKKDNSASQSQGAGFFKGQTSEQNNIAIQFNKDIQNTKSPIEAFSLIKTYLQDSEQSFDPPSFIAFLVNTLTEQKIITPKPLYGQEQLVKELEQWVSAHSDVVVNSNTP